MARCPIAARLPQCRANIIVTPRNSRLAASRIIAEAHSRRWFWISVYLGMVPTACRRANGKSQANQCLMSSVLNPRVMSFERNGRRESKWRPVSRGESGAMGRKACIYWAFRGRPRPRRIFPSGKCRRIGNPDPTFSVFCPPSGQLAKYATDQATLRYPIRLPSCRGGPSITAVVARERPATTARI